jgi:hypothetical protein
MLLLFRYFTVTWQLSLPRLKPDTSRTWVLPRIQSCNGKTETNRPWSRVHEKLGFSANHEIPCLLCDTKFYYRVDHSAHHWYVPVLSQTHSLHTPNPISIWSNLIPSFYLCQRLSSGLFTSKSPNNILYFSSPLCVLHALPIFPPWVFSYFLILQQWHALFCYKLWYVFGNNKQRSKLKFRSAVTLLKSETRIYRQRKGKR